VNNVKGVPFLSEIPVLGALFRSSDFQNDRSELLFVITAHLVKPEGEGAGLDGAAAAAAQARYRKSFSEPAPDTGERK
jgi:pilus assembly protein CpaC